MLSRLNLLVSFIIDTVFPPPPLVQRLIGLSVEEIISEISRSDSLPDKNSIAILSYKHPLTRTAIWEMKYRGNRAITRKMALVIYDYLLIELSEASTWQNFTEPIIVPIPLSPERLRERGYNQAGKLAKELVKIDKGENFKLNSDWLKKVRSTDSQSHTRNRTERLNNLKNCFSASSDVEGKNIILLDDVITTGATMKEAKNTLRQAGAKKVICVAVAH
ncbi:MAG: phosphoribosyltransferase family protein [Minisyncoccia bacterium]